MNKQEVELAVGAGLELLGKDSEVPIPARLNDGVFLLKQLLLLVASGQLGLMPTVQKKPPPPPPPNPTRNKKRPARKKKKKS